MILIVYGTGYDQTEFGYEEDGRIAILRGLRPMSSKPDLMQGCTGSKLELCAAPRTARRIDNLSDF